MSSTAPPPPPPPPMAPQYVAAPGGGTSIAAALLAFPGAVVAVVCGLDWAREAADRMDSPISVGERWASVFVTVSATAQFLGAVLLGCGAFAMLLRSRVGRAAVVLGCALILVDTFATVLVTSRAVDINYYYYGYGYTQLTDAGQPLGIAVSAMTIAFATLTLFLARAASTTRWLTHRPSAQWMR